MKKQPLIFLLLGALITGCAVNQYHAKDYQGNGYSEYRMTSDRFAVTYRGSRNTDPEDVKHYALKRAAEVTSNYGYRYFVVESERDLTKTTVVKSTKEETTLVEDLWTDLLYPVKSTKEQASEKKNYALELSIRCFTSRPKKEEAIDAYQFLAYNITSDVS